MLIEMIKLKDVPKYNLCPCNNHRYTNDIEGRAYITSDNVRFYGNAKTQVAEFIQFPYTYREWCSAHYENYRCLNCGTIPYRIISSKGIKQILP